MPHLERGEEEWVSSILESENAEEEAVHQEDYGGPGHDGNSLCFGISYAWDFDGEGDCCKGEDTIWEIVSGSSPRVNDRESTNKWQQ